MTTSSWWHRLVRKDFATPRRSARRPVWPTRLRPLLETLEARVVLSATRDVITAPPHLLVVTTTQDNVPGSLRDAITRANQDSAADTITFALTPNQEDPSYDFQSGAFTLRPTSALPSILHPLTLDGTSQQGYSDHPLVALDGSSAGANADGLTISASNVQVSGLAIENFGGNGVVVNDPNLSQGDPTVGVTNVALNALFIGVDALGNNAAGNGGDGILLNAGVQHAQIGSTYAGQGNLIAHNHGAGIHVIGRAANDTTQADPSLRWASAQRNNIEGNYVGVSLAPFASILDSEPSLHVAGNDGDGIFIDNHASAQYLASNVVAGNGGNGVHLRITAFNQLNNNYIGTDPRGDALGNAQDGILIESGIDTARGNQVLGSVFNRIGGGSHADVANGSNVITANGGNGIHIRGVNTASNVVDGNTIGAISYPFYSQTIAEHVPAFTGGLTLGGDLSTIETPPFPPQVTLGNALDGVLIDQGASKNLVGFGSGTAGVVIGLSYASAGNTIDFNRGEGVEVAGTGSDNNVIAGNRIGAPLPALLNGFPYAVMSFNTGNGKNGVSVNNGGNAGGLIGPGPYNTLIGGTAPEAANTIVNQPLDGVLLGNAGPTQVLGNAIYDNFGQAIHRTPAAGPNMALTLTAALPISTGVQLSGTLHSLANTPAHVEFFYQAPAGGNSRPLTFLGSQDVTLNDFGDYSFTTDLALPANSDPHGFLAATATVAGNTSEFSKHFALGDSAALSLVSGDGQSGFLHTNFGQPLVVHLTLNNAPLAGAVVVFTSPSRIAGNSIVGGLFILHPASAGETPYAGQTFFPAISSSIANGPIGEVVTDANGNASITFTANAFPGDEAIFASVPGAQGSAVAFALHNLPVAFHVTAFSGANGGVSAGEPANVTLQVVDPATGTPIPNYLGDFSLTTNDPHGVGALASIAHGAAGDSWNFSVTLQELGTHKITISDPDNSKINTVVTTLVVEGAPARVDLGSASPTLTAGDKGLFTVHFFDAFGNPTPYESSNPTLTLLSPNAPPQTLSLSSTDTHGAFTFEATLLHAGVNTLVLPAANSLSGQTLNFTVQPAAATELIVSGLPTNIVAPGAPLTFVVTAKDPFGNVDTGFHGTLAFASNDPAAVLPKTTTLKDGTGTFTAILTQPGVDTLSVSAGAQIAAAPTVEVESLTGTFKHLVEPLGSVFTATVAHFDDTALAQNPALLAQFTASVSWGDQQSSSLANGDVTIKASPTGGFDVLSAHNYPDDKTYTVTVSVANQSSHVSATVTGRAYVLTAAQNSVLENPTFLQPAQGSASATLTQGSVTAVLSFNQAGGSDGTTTLFSGEYQQNPQPNTDQTGLFFELKGSNVPASATLTLTISYAELNTTNVVLVYFNVADNQFEAVPSDQFINDPVHKTLTFTLSATTTPKLQDVVHTVFAVTLAPPPAAPATTPAVQAAQVTQVTPTVAQANNAPSVLGQALTQRSDTANAPTVAFEADFQTSGPTVSLATSADRTTSTGVTSSVGGEGQHNDLDSITAAAQSAALRLLHGVSDIIDNGVPLDETAKPAPKKPDEAMPPETEETAALDLVWDINATEFSSLAVTPLRSDYAGTDDLLLTPELLEATTRGPAVSALGLAAGFLTGAVQLHEKKAKKALSRKKRRGRKYKM